MPRRSWRQRSAALLRGLAMVWALSALAHAYLAGVYVHGVRADAGGRPLPSSVLLVTAHPDDECMFFAPTVLALQARNVSVHALCLSSGNADGLGDVRAAELYKSFETLGVDAAHVGLVDDAALPDSMSVEWRAEDIRRVVEPVVHAHEIEAILTFDERGVSLHPNHRALVHGVRTVAPRADMPLELWTLHTWSWRIKFLSYVTSAAQRWAPHDVVVLAPWSASWQALSAMRQHTSQLVWFRYLYVLTSAYMHANAWHTGASP